MNTQELIKQAENLLSKCSEGLWKSEQSLQAEEHFGYPAVVHTNLVNDSYTFAIYDQCCDIDNPVRANAANLLAFARNHLAEIIDKLKKYEAVVLKAAYGIATNNNWNSHEQLIEKVNELSDFAKKVLEE